MVYWYVSSTLYYCYKRPTLQLNPFVIVFKFANIHITIVAVIFGYWAICVTPLFVAFLQANVRVNNHCSMSYKTRPTGDFLKTGKSQKIGCRLCGQLFSLLPIFSRETYTIFTKNDSLSYQPDIKLKLLQKLTRFLIFLFCC